MRHAILSAKEHDAASSLTYLDSAYECIERAYIDLQETKGAYYQDLIRQERENRLQQERNHRNFAATNTIINPKSKKT